MARTTLRPSSARAAPRDGADALRALQGIVPGGYAGIATRLSVSRQTVSAWANRRATPSVWHIRRMARRLGVSARLWGVDGGQSN